MTSGASWVTRILTQEPVIVIVVYLNGNGGNAGNDPTGIRRIIDNRVSLDSVVRSVESGCFSICFGWIAASGTGGYSFLGNAPNHTGVGISVHTELPAKNALCAGPFQKKYFLHKLRAMGNSVNVSHATFYAGDAHACESVQRHGPKLQHRHQS